jgi:AraC-like DNA-binding protein
MYSEGPSRLPHVIAWRSVTPPGHSRSRVLPDGCMDLIWHDGHVFVAGPDSTAQVFESSSAGRLFGLRFGAATLPRLAGIPADEFTDRHVPLDAIWQAADVRRIAESDRPAEALEEAALRRWHRPDPALVDVAGWAQAGWTVDAMAVRLGLSARHLQRRVKAGFGYGPKHLTRILRLQRALALARRGTPFAEVSATTGYADQAHLSREVRALAGVPLSSLT